jgi:hypothetical protein
MLEVIGDYKKKKPQIYCLGLFQILKENSPYQLRLMSNPSKFQYD